MRRIVEEVKPVYLASTIYKHTIWKHVLRVACFARDFATDMPGANDDVAWIAGILHDIGGAKYGPENHHITGKQEASVVLAKCNCPAEHVGIILDAIYSHRGSQKIPLKTPEARCVAAADTKDHLEFIEELWVAQTIDLGVPVEHAHYVILQKLARDWAKTDPQIRLMLWETYKKALVRLSGIAHNAKVLADIS